MGDSPDNSADLPWMQGDGEVPEPSAAELEAAGQHALFGDAGAAPPPAPPVVAPPRQPVPEIAQPYRVLARKYRPQTFSQLIGQEPMVRTLGNAIVRDRLAHAFLMTGVRGVGKTSTARLIAKALNCIVCEPCVAIAEGRHIDVIEMDAASHTGVDDVREIIEAVRYAAVSARYKIYIIDEVHMLTRNAFNALLKTLEEPPAHVKFLFATTEADKLPVTVLSRTQRFDLRRIPAAMLQQHFGSICRLEGVAAEDEALHMITAAAEGSVRDGLSILDQAIAHADLDSNAGGQAIVTAERVQDMLGLADRGAQRKVMEALLAGDSDALLDGVEAQHALGVEPVALLRGLMELIHRTAVAQIGRSGADGASAEERAAIEDWATRLSAGQVHRLWQLLLKGHDELRHAPDPLVAAQMALLRAMHAADMPDPGTLAKKLEGMAANSASHAPAAGAQGASAAPVASLDLAELADQVDASGHLRVAQIMRDWVRVIELAPGQLVYALSPGYSGDPGPEMRDALCKVTGERWTIEQGAGEGTPSLREQADAERESAEARLRDDPLVAAAFAAFPGAEMITEDAPRGSTRGDDRHRSNFA